MTKDDVTRICNARGHCYLDTYVARAFALDSGQPEEIILRVLERQESISLQKERGRGRFERARERACMMLAVGWERAESGSEDPWVAGATAAEIVAAMEPAAAYGVLAWRDKTLGRWPN